MLHVEIVESVKKAVHAKGLPETAGERILAWLKEAEGGNFAVRDQREQLHKILDAMNGYDSSTREEV